MYPLHPSILNSFEKDYDDCFHFAHGHSHDNLFDDDFTIMCVQSVTRVIMIVIFDDYEQL